MPDYNRIQSPVAALTPFIFQKGCVAFLVGAWLLGSVQSGWAQPTSANNAQERAKQFSPAGTGTVTSSPTALVKWQLWSSETFQAAVEKKQPIFLFIADQADHWSQAMQREVLSLPEIADELNRNFTCIYLDQELHPELATVYQIAKQEYLRLAKTSTQLQWPAVLFLTPEQEPFAAGTYSPLHDQPGQPGFASVLRHVHQAWTTREIDARSTAGMIGKQVTRKFQPGKSTASVDQQLVDVVVQSVTANVSLMAGLSEGTSDSPEIASDLRYRVDPFCLQLLQSQSAKPVEATLNPVSLVDQVLRKLGDSGIYDAIGGGFHHGASNADWTVPRFQKLLTDNALLAEVYFDAYRRTGRESYRRTAEQTLDFILRDLTATDGGFYSSLGADSSGGEGRYYVWTREELEQLLRPSEMRICLTMYGLNDPHTFPAGYVLARTGRIEEIAGQLALPVKELEVRLAEIQKKLFDNRQQRQPPERSQLILTCSNGLAIRVLAAAGSVLKRRDYMVAAERAALRILTLHRDTSGRLLRTAHNQPVAPPAILDDYACFVSSLLTLYDVTGEEKWLNAARRLTDEQIGAFWDQQQHGFFLTPHGQSVPMTRVKLATDGALPSGNGVSAQNLVRLSRTRFGESYRSHAAMTLAAFGGSLEQTPSRSATMALALQDHLHWFGRLEPTGAAGEGLFTGGLSTPRELPGTPKSSGMSPDAGQSKDGSPGRSPGRSVPPGQNVPSVDAVKPSGKSELPSTPKAKELPDATLQNSGTPRAMPSDLKTKPESAPESVPMTNAEAMSDKKSEGMKGISSDVKSEVVSESATRSTQMKSNSIRSTIDEPVAPIVKPGVLIPSPVEVMQNPNLTAQAFVTMQELPAGHRCAVVIDLNVVDGWTILAAQEQTVGLTPLQVTVVSPVGVTIGDMRFPHPIDVPQTDGLRSLLGIAGQTAIIGWISVPEEIQGEQVLTLRIDYQPCRGQERLPPQEIHLTAKMNVARKGTPVTRANVPEIEEILRRINSPETKQRSEESAPEQ
ncbi:DUF255 domain-containing protein [Planctomicrobium sp. SH527]|uniref:thioredoxin domain-containing protein n=1 Tax=Planctomicrobium sp. SH527 TaxID=3448123 RepID=UPI003F5B7B31